MSTDPAETENHDLHLTSLEIAPEDLFEPQPIWVVWRRSKLAVAWDLANFVFLVIAGSWIIWPHGGVLDLSLNERAALVGVLAVFLASELVLARAFYEVLNLRPQLWDAYTRAPHTDLAEGDADAGR